MTRGRASRIVVGLALTTGVTGLAGGATAHATNARGASPRSAVQVGSAAELPARARFIAPLRSDHRLQLTIALGSRDPRGLAAFADAVSSPGSPGFRHYLSVAQFAHRFGATPGALSATTTAFRRAGLHVGAPAADALTIPVTGTASEVDDVLGAQVDAIRLASGARAFANRAAPAIPAAAARYVQGVSGLDDLDVAAHATVLGRPSRVGGPVADAAPRVVTGGPQPCGAAVDRATTIFQGSVAPLAYRSGYTADLLASVYGFSGLYGGGDIGAGQTVAIVAETPYGADDVAAFQGCYGTAASVSNVVVGAGVGTTVADDEGALDIEAVTAMAPGARVLVYEGTDQVAILSRMVSDNAAKVISSSWATCESSASATLSRSYTTLLQEAAAQGQSVFASSGDSGSTCGTTLGTQLPASSPLVTAVGGTTLYSLDSEGASEPFAQGRTPIESVWNNGLVNSAPTATGGGLSRFFAIPDYQSGAAPSLGVVGPDAGGTCGAVACRQVPDVSADGDGGSGYVVFSRGGWTVIGGTSFSAPLWAAFTALTNAAPACRGLSIGFANPALYQLAGGSSAGSLFTDITTASPRTAAVGNDAAATNGGRYALRTGYDMATGLGSMHGAALAAALCQLRAPVFTVALANPGPQTSITGTPVALQLQRADAGPLPLSYTASGLPPGLTMSATGAITGTPTTPGSYPVIVTAVDSATNQAATQFEWTVTQLVTPVHRPGKSHGRPSIGIARLTAILGGRPTLRFTVKAPARAPAIRSLSLSLPSSLTLASGRVKLRRGVTVTGGGRREKLTIARRGGRLRLRLSRPARSATIVIRAPAIAVRPRLRAAVRHHRARTLRARLAVTDTGTRSTRLVLRIRI